MVSSISSGGNTDGKTVFDDGAIVLATAALSAQGSVAGDWDLSINGPEGVITATADAEAGRREGHAARSPARRAPSN